MTTLTTERLIMRQWQATDFPAYAKINQNPEVMEFYPSMLTPEESHAQAEKFRLQIEQKGWGFWALSLKNDERFIGFVGLNDPTYDLPFSPCVEIGWRIDSAFWRKGYAYEAAQKSLQFGFEVLNLEEIVSFTSTTNLKSKSLMKKLAMTDTQQNFQHPLIADGHPLSEHVLYKIRNPALPL